MKKVCTTTEGCHCILGGVVPKVRTTTRRQHCIVEGVVRGSEVRTTINHQAMFR